MLIAPHFLVGTAIATHTDPNEFWLAALAALTSHFILDSIPHRDTIGGFHINTANVIMEMFDVGFTFAVFFLLVPKSLWLYGLAISGVAILPDIIAIPGLFWPQWYQLPIIKPLHWWHTKIIQPPNEKMSWFWGLLPQILTVGTAIYFLTMKPL